jgi:peptidoglycan hydrolase-like protein with peptidoglycan-binding domain
MACRPAVALLVSACFAVGVVSGAAADRPHPDPNVAGLQTALAIKGFYRGRVDGLRGPQTTAALRALQRQFRLPSSNLIDRRTRAALGALGRPRYGTRTLRRGQVGLDVAALQFELRYHGFAAPATGYFAERTLRALERFQHFAGIRADGVAGRATYAALAKPPSVVPKLKPPLPLTQRARRVGEAVEIGCPYATAVAASIGGTVIFAANRRHGYGYTVVTRDANGLELLYAHLARIDVAAGQRLVAGAMIGLAGWTGKKRPETSLRLELRLRGARLDTYSALYGH